MLFLLAFVGRMNHDIQTQVTPEMHMIPNSQFPARLA